MEFGFNCHHDDRVNEHLADPPWFGWVRTNPQPDASPNQRYEMIVDNKLNLFRKVYQQECFEI